ncbi:MAG: NADH-quinone oxidoreductase subunit C [Actinobacteria bacterium]|nr:NADH-quinone oxidoreductase subunit C [Actinomycetota bacterium]
MSGVTGPPGPLWEPWADAVAQRVAAGFDRLDLLTAVDRPASGEIEIVIHLVRRPEAGGLEDVWGHTLLDRAAPMLESVTGLLPAAAWHEREIHEMFGVQVSGHPDLRPLLLLDVASPPPLRKDTPLVARVDTPWPGARR